MVGSSRKVGKEGKGVKDKTKDERYAG